MRTGEKRCLTPHSSRAPTARRQARGTVQFIICTAGLAPHRWARLSSNVRPHKMLRALFKFIAAFIAGPLLALAVISLGCSGQDPLLGVACGHNAYLSLIALSVCFWFLLIVALSIRSAIKENF